MLNKSSMDHLKKKAPNIMQNSNSFRHIPHKIVIVPIQRKKILICMMFSNLPDLADSCDEPGFYGAQSFSNGFRDGVGWVTRVSS